MSRAAWISRPHVLAAAGTVAATLALFLAFNAGVEWMERRGRVDTFRGIDDMLVFVDEPLFALGADGWYRTSYYGAKSMVPGQFRAEKGGAWRAFILGESFAMGTPYVVQGRPQNFPGSIPFFLGEDLETMAHGRAVEVVNMAAGGQNSHRVKRTAEQVLDFSPDVVFLATCNNEGEPPPARVAELMHRYGGVRLIRKLTLPPVSPEERSVFTPQDPDTDAVRAAFSANIRSILARSREKGVNVLVATLPVNLRYDGAGPRHLREQAIPMRPCLATGLALWKEGRLSDARSTLQNCDDAGALRTLGLLEYEAGSYVSAARLLKQSVELVPLNRCRPSFNQVIREEAAKFPNARLVDLEAEAEAASPHGVPGRELFFDYCHMNWKGYALMERAMVKTLDKAGWLPGKPGPTKTLDELRVRYGLDENPEPFEL